MSTILQNNNTSFVIQTYRELVKNKKKVLLSQRIRDIAQQQGQFVRLYKRRPGEYEAIFSSDPGYLLGESIKHYFQQAKNLIFCETAPDSSQLLLVIIKNGDVFMDTLIDASQLKKELLPLSTLKTKFQLVLSGEFNFPETLTPDNPFFFPENLILSYEYIENSLVPRLPLFSHAKLLPLPLALKAENLNGDSLLTIGILVIAVLVTLISLFAYLHMKQSPPISKLPQKITPYADYLAALQTPAPAHLLETTADLITTLYQLPGWSARSIVQTNNNTHIALESTGGNLQQMQRWATQHHFSVLLAENGVQLTTPHSPKPRAAITTIHPITPLIEALIDDLQRLTPDGNIQVTKNIRHHDSRETLMTLDFTELSLQQLNALKFVFNNLPIVLHQIEITMDDNLLLHSTIQLSIWGS